MDGRVRRQVVSKAADRQYAAASRDIGTDLALQTMVSPAAAVSIPDADETLVDHDLFGLAHRLRASTMAGYGLALILSGTAFLVRMALGPWLVTSPYLTFIPAVLLTALLGGIGPSLVAGLLCGLAAVYFIAVPHGSFLLAWPEGWISLISYVFVVGVIVILVEGVFRSHARLEAADSRNRQLNAVLEDRVRERTALLEAKTVQLVAEADARAAVEDQLRQSQKLEAIGQLAGGIAHDFNNMMSIVIGSLDLARRRLAAGNLDITRFIDGAMEGATRGAELTHRLLAFSRRQPLQPVVLDSGRIVAGMSELLRRAIGEAIDVECVLAGGLWATCIDPGELENAILNLAVNARDAMPGGGSLTIETQNGLLDDSYAAAHKEVKAGQYVVVSVTDTGSGMTPDTIARATEPFFTTKDTGKGTGLGLSQVFGFVKQSGGHFKIYSEPGRGTTVKLYFPRHLDAAKFDRAPGLTPPDSIPEGKASELVLVVEDDRQVRLASVESLRDLGYTVRHAGNGQAALALLAEIETVALLFTDIVMPGMNGRKLAEEAMQRIPGLKVLYTTGYTENAVVHGGILDPGLALLTKPFTIHQLARKVRTVLDEDVVDARAK